MNGRIARALRRSAGGVGTVRVQPTPTGRRRVSARKTYRGLKRQYARLRSGR